MTFFAEPPPPQPLPPRKGSDWAEVLEPGERLLWEGRPDPRLMLRWKHVPQFVVGLAFLALSVLFMVQAVAALRSGDDEGGGMMFVGLALIGFGLWSSVGPVVGDMLRRRGSAYALTDRRALIETDFMGKGLLSCRITRDSPLVLKRGRPPTAVFAVLRRSPISLERMFGAGRNRKLEVIGFECIPEAEHVLSLMREIQVSAEREEGE